MLHTKFINLYMRMRRMKYRFLSDCSHVEGSPIVRQPTIMQGKGTIRFNGTVNLGFASSPYFYSGYIYLESRSPESVIQIDTDVWINNNSCIVSDGAGVFIGKKTMLGVHCEIIDSDFHDLHPDRRADGKPKMGKVIIGENVLIGSNVKIMKGVRIGNNTIIANGAVVTRSVPENMVVFGNPQKAGPGLVPE